MNEKTIIWRGKAIAKPVANKKFTMSRSETLSLIAKVKEPKPFELPIDSIKFADLPVKELKSMIISVGQKNELDPDLQDYPKYLVDTLTQITNNKTFVDLNEVRDVKDEALWWLTREIRNGVGYGLMFIKNVINAKPKPTILSLAYIETQNKLGRRTFREYGRVPFLRTQS